MRRYKRTIVLPQAQFEALMQQHGFQYITQPTVAPLKPIGQLCRLSADVWSYYTNTRHYTLQGTEAEVKAQAVQIDQQESKEKKDATV